MIVHVVHKDTRFESCCSTLCLETLRPKNLIMSLPLVISTYQKYTITKRLTNSAGYSKNSRKGTPAGISFSGVRI